jgi:hypothetical protein
MNKNHKPVDAKTRKKLQKEVKKGQPLLSEEPVLRTDTLTAKKALKKYPVKRQKMEKPLVEKVAQTIRIKKTKKSAKHSKRTTPGQVRHRESPPAHIHPEGEVWNRTSKKQSQINRAALSKKLQKGKSHRKIK